MIGAMIGDIVGSIYEFNNIKTKDFPFWGRHTDYTDDSLMTLAVANVFLPEAVHNGVFIRVRAIESMQAIGRQYPHPKGAYGHGFKHWLRDENPTPYYSFGNGSAMRTSACAYVTDTLEEALDYAKWCAEVTHNHPEGIKGAQAVTACIWLARHGATKDEIRAHVEEHYYRLDQTVDEIRAWYYFDSSCQGTAPQAIQAFLEATDFEDAIRNAVSIGGDTDTLSAISGSIAEAFFGVPEEMRAKAESYLEPDLLEILHRFEERYQ